MRNYTVQGIMCWAFLAIACQPSAPPDRNDVDGEAPEVDVQTLPLESPFNDRNLEYSELFWVDDFLILVPQYPDKYENRLVMIRRAAIEDALATRQAIKPQWLPFGNYEMVTQLRDSLPNESYQGIEAAERDGNRFVIILETEVSGVMRGYLFTGEIQMSAQAPSLTLTEGPIEIPDDRRIDNHAYESVLIPEPGRYIAIHETNVSRFVGQPTAMQIEGETLTTVPHAEIEYRITGATALDDQNRFWTTNVMWGDVYSQLGPTSSEAIFLETGVPPSHSDVKHVERLVEFELTDSAIVRTERPPIWLKLRSDDAMRNWEGIARLNDGLLIVSDKFPLSILGFVTLASGDSSGS